MAGLDRIERRIFLFTSYWLAVCLGVLAVALGFNALGHKVVNEIAWQRLDPDTRQEIIDVIRRHPIFDFDFPQKMPADIHPFESRTAASWDAEERV